MLKDYFLPLSQSQIRVQEEKLKSLRMRSNENPATFFASMRRDAWCSTNIYVLLYCFTAVLLYVVGELAGVTAVYSTNTAELLFYAAIPVLLYCCCPVVHGGFDGC